WTQGMEGDLDPGHLPFLHGGIIAHHEIHGQHASADWLTHDLSPKLEAFPRPSGLLYASRREADADSYFWRIGLWFLPFHTSIPGFPGLGPLAGHAWVPVDDHRTAVFTFSWHPARPITPEELEGIAGGGRTHAELIPGTFTPARNKSNE